METPTQHPILLLFLATLLAAVGLIKPKFAPHWPAWFHALTRVVIFILLTVLIQKVVGSPLRPHFATTNSGERLWGQLVETSWWLLGARGSIGIIRLVIILEDKPQESQIVSDLLAGAIYIATLLAIVDFAFAVPIGGLLATSGVIAIVLGLALQNTLSDVFSGIAVGLERPYRPGDLLWVEGPIEGHVTHVTWRSTHIATSQNNIAVVPNSVIAKARLVNRSLPTGTRTDSIELRLDANALPEHCLTVLEAATLACRLPLAAPTVQLAALQGDGSVFEVSFAVLSSAALSAARTELFMQIHRHLRHAGINMAVAGVAKLAVLEPPSLKAILKQSTLFGVIDTDQRDMLADRFTTVTLPAETTLIQLGGFPEVCFIIACGTAEITVEDPSGPRVVYRMSPGEALGAIALVTGSPYAVTAKALTPLKVYRLDTTAVAAAIKRNPELSHALEALAQHGMATQVHDAAVHPDLKSDHPEMFLSRLRTFLRVSQD
ncbi:mechanosensitive ion channel (plasmid) [Lichenicola cladoniae]|uniref:Small-conductance mechanosensitive channel n=1 Tax=Lichenicola cladoniae TaxID=1484109 RepID=A0A6M8HYP5_9PROT|nr:mechanosensitive ion channel family protein [Lichenicola cladoniae]NPD70246.1 mechanosensitive ion channel [Acetobacteraceae bacterium]QKE93376.1 mechanosensitive ion channel [Lichenicola cladoniae]